MGKVLTSCGLTSVSFNLPSAFDLSFIHADIFLHESHRRVSPVLWLMLCLIRKAVWEPS